jgi:L-ascorbate metabolism protein UlaG (beta-lactamase superfamily)
MVKLLYQGHASFRLAVNNYITYIDPYAGEQYDEPADLILVTHQHYDHNQVELPARKHTCQLWQNMDSHPSKDVYLAKQFGPLEISATVACNKNHPIDQCVGYLIRTEGITLWFAGDTSYVPEMKTQMPKEHIDYAFLPGDGIFNMDIDEAARCANLIGAKNVTPIHLYPDHLYSDKLAHRFKDLADNCLLIRPGEEITLVHQ